MLTIFGFLLLLFSTVLGPQADSTLCLRAACIQRTFLASHVLLVLSCMLKFCLDCEFTVCLPPNTLAWHVLLCSEFVLYYMNWERNFDCLRNQNVFQFSPTCFCVDKINHWCLKITCSLFSSYLCVILYGFPLFCTSKFKYNQHIRAISELFCDCVACPLCPATL